MIRRPYIFLAVMLAVFTLSIMACGDNNEKLQPSSEIAAGACTEADAELCTRLGKNCDVLNATDNCGKSRSVNCGTSCSEAGATCGGGGTPNVCGSPTTPTEEPPYRIAYVTEKGAKRIIYGAVTGSSPSKAELYSNFGFNLNPIHLTFSPDGSTLLYALNMGSSANSQGLFSFKPAELSVPGSGDPKELVDDSSAPLKAFYPTYNADGSKIAFATGGCSVLKRISSSGGATVTEGDDGPGTINSYSYGRVSISPVKDTSNPSYNKMVFALDKDGGGANYQLVMKTFGVFNYAEHRDLTTPGSNEEAPIFSPDGSMVAFITDTKLAVCTMDFATPTCANIKTLLPTGGQDQPCWSHDGKRIFYGQDGEIFSVKVDGTGVINHTASPELDGYPACSPVP